MVNTCKCNFGLSMLCSRASSFPRKEGGIYVLAGLSPSSQKVRFLLNAPWQAKLARKIQQKVSLTYSLQRKSIFNHF